MVYNELCVGEHAALELEADTGASTARPYCWPCCCAVVLLVPLALTSWLPIDIERSAGLLLTPACACRASVLVKLSARAAA